MPRFDSHPCSRQDSPDLVRRKLMNRRLANLQLQYQEQNRVVHMHHLLLGGDRIMICKLANGCILYPMKVQEKLDLKL